MNTGTKFTIKPRELDRLWCVDCTADTVYTTISDGDSPTVTFKDDRGDIVILYTKDVTVVEGE